VNILVANDDGVFAPGLQALAQALNPLGRVVVVAPESERSGYSSALTLDRPLRPIPIAEDVWAVNGTPADCVYLSMNVYSILNLILLLVVLIVAQTWVMMCCILGLSALLLKGV